MTALPQPVDRSQAAPTSTGRLGETMRDRMATIVTRLLDDDPRLFVVLADISARSFERAAAAHPRRVVNVGIMEQTMVSMAAGVALEGFIPVLHSIAPFLVERPYEQIKDDFVYQGLGGNFVSIGASYDYSADGMTHHGPGDVPILKVLPRIEIVVPGAPSEFEALFRASYADGAPTYFRLSISSNSPERAVRFGRLDVVRLGSRATVVAVGPMLQRTLEAIEGLDVSVLYCTTVVPFDARTLRAVGPGAVGVVLVEPYYAGTLVPDVVAALSPDPVRVEAIGVPRQIVSGYGEPHELDETLGLTAADIRRRIDRFLDVARA